MRQKKIATTFYRNLLFSLLHTAIFSVLLLQISSCSSSKRINKDYIYFRNGADTIITQQKETIIQANDLLSIQVSSRTLNQEQAAIFNSPVSANSQTQAYQVTQDGNINLPVIGNVKAGGLTKYQLQASLVTRLTEYVKNPTVIVKFQQFNINVLGEVKSPGTQKFQVDKVTIIDALSAAGDLTDFGKREDVKVIREENGTRITYVIDLRNRNIFESPVYLLQPNDIVYVSPTTNKLRNLSVNPDAQRRTGLIFSITSIALSVASLVIFSTKY